MGSNIPSLDKVSFLNFLLDRNKTSGCSIGQVLPEFFLPIESFYLPKASGQAFVSNTADFPCGVLLFFNSKDRFPNMVI